MPSLEFKGKQHIYAHHLTVPYRPLVPDAAKSYPHRSDEVQNSSADQTPDGNLIIHGDNLHALKALLPRYASRVKCIYIDPPYNTGNENWTYNDNVNSPLMQQWLSENGPVDNEDLERHDKWLCMMWPRLHMLKELLADDGMIFISIDDNEQHHLRTVMDEIFGEENFLTCVSWEKRFTRSNNAKMFTSVVDKLVVYRRGKLMSFLREPRNKKSDAIYTNPDNDPRGQWTSVSYVNPATGSQRPNLVYAILNPHTGEEIAHPTNAWKFEQKEHKRHVSEKKLWWGENGQFKYPRLKKFLSEVSQGLVPVDLWRHADSGTTDEGSRELEQIIGRAVFDNPKPTRLIERIIRLCADKGGIVLDSFAGSGTTAHAVLALNKEDGGNRKFILVECEDYADSITAERVRRVSTGVPGAKDKALREGLGGSFTYCTLGEPIELEGMLTGEALPPYAALAAYLLHTVTGVSAGENALRPQGDDGLFHRDDLTDYYLLYEPNVAWLRGSMAMLNEERAQRISAAGRAHGRKAVVFAAGKYIGQRELTAMGITFCQLPYEMHHAGT